MPSSQTSNPMPPDGDFGGPCADGPDDDACDDSDADDPINAGPKDGEPLPDPDDLEGIDQ